MSEGASNQTTDQFEELLIKYDEQFARGTTPMPEEETPSQLDAETVKRLQRATGCLQMIERVRRSDPTSMTPPVSIPGSGDTRLAGVADSEGSPLEADELPRSIGRFQIIRELGRGGYGVVCLALDPDLGREIALKVPRPEAILSSDLKRRFLREGKAVASLSHAGIVPVFEVGHIGSVYYIVSAYCKGVSLAQWLQTRSPGARKENGLVSPDTAARIVQKLAEAIQHAHGRGVVHRDLKPSNVLLEAVDQESNGHTEILDWFRPLVTDFGLAKTSTVGGDETRTGAILGTPAYMAPEQATGLNHDIGPPADIYALGTILYELLTGRPPFSRESDLATLRAVEAEEPTPPSRLRRGLPRDLEAICLKCLEKAPPRRYVTATDLALDLERFIEGRPVLARRSGVFERSMRWCGRNPLAASLLTGLLSVLVAGIISTSSLWLLAEANLDDAEEQRSIAQSNLELYEANYLRARTAVDEMLSELGHKHLEHIPQMTEVRRRILDKALKFNQEFLLERNSDPAVLTEMAMAHFRLGDIYKLLGDSKSALDSYHEAARFSDQLMQEIPDDPAHGCTKASALSMAGRELVKTGKMEEAEVSFRDAIELSEILSKQFPENPLVRQCLEKSYGELGLLLKNTGRMKESEEAQTRSLEHIEKLRAEFPDNVSYAEQLARTLGNLANLYQLTGRPRESEALLGRNIEILKKLVADFPENVGYRNPLGTSYNSRAVLMLRTGRPADAEDDLRNAIDVMKSLSVDYPRVPEFRESTAGYYMNLGILFAQGRRFDEAEGQIRGALALLQGLATEFPASDGYKESAAGATMNLGAILKDSGQFAEAEEVARRAVALYETLTARPKSLLRSRHRLAQCHLILADILASTQKTADAEQSFRNAVESFERMIKDAPQIVEARSELGATLSKLADLLATHEDRLNEARSMCERAMAHQREALQVNPRHPHFLKRMKGHYRTLASIALYQKDYASAAEAASESATASPTNSDDKIEAASILARASSLVQTDDGLIESKRVELHAQYAGQAIKFLSEASNEGIKDTNRLKTDSAFDVLRKDERFKQIVEARGEEN